MDRDPLHLVVRYGNQRLWSPKYSGLEPVDTIQLHEDVLQRRGAVWFAKFGKTLGIGHITRLNEQIQAGVNTYLYLVGKRIDNGGGKPRWFRARLTDVQRSKPPLLSDS